MGRLDWDQNAYHHRVLLRQLPSHCGRVLDVGGGAGALATRLAARADRVDAMDRSPEMISIARVAAPANVECIAADFMDCELPARTYDAVVSLSTLHHLPLEPALRRMAASLRPGGVLAAIALPKTDLPRELAVEAVAAPGYRLLGAAFAVARATGRGHGFRREPSHDAMPVVLDPTLTTRAVRATAHSVLPGARVRRLLFWRYLLTWRKPDRSQPVASGRSPPCHAR